MISLFKPPAYLSTTRLTANAASSTNIGGARIAAALLQVDPTERQTRDAAGHLFANTSPGWRQSDAVIYACQASLSWCEALLQRESARKISERALRASGVSGVVYWNGSVGLVDAATQLVTRVVSS